MSNLLYDALMLGRNKKVENEEFLTATGKKEPASFKVSEDCINISNVISDGEFFVHLIMETPGYIEIEVLCYENFIIYDKKIITSEEFVSGKYDFRFMVISDRLHNGKNYSSLVFRTSGQEYTVPINIDNKIRVRISDVNPRSRLISLERAYLDVRLQKIMPWEWEKTTLDLLNDIDTGDVQSLFLMLYKAQVYLSRNDNVHARNFIEYVGTQIPKLEHKNYGLYCFFIYLASLYEEVEGARKFTPPYDGSDVMPVISMGYSSRRNARASEEMMDMSSLQKVRWVYANYPGWFILWILYYMDPELRADKARTLSYMRDVFYNEGCTSPVLYLEALEILRADPELLDGAGQFELQTANFGLRNGCMTGRLSSMLAREIINTDSRLYSDSERRLAIQVLKKAYEKYNSSIILKALCNMLMELDIRNQDVHSYFAKAVDEGMEGEDICSYYIYTMDQSQMGQIPAAVMKYFTDRTELFYEYTSYMYANIITHKYSDPETYKRSLESILRFAEYQIMMGQNNEYLAVIYREILENDLITANMKDNLFDVVCTKEILCSNSRMRSVLVFHKELQVYQESMLRNGRAYIKIYTSDALILFQDYTGNMYYRVDYTINQLLQEKEYIDKCIKDARINKYMLMGDALPLLRAYKPAADILEFFTSNKIYGQFRHEYELELLNNMVSYYARNSRDEAVYDQLLKFLDFELQPATRGILVGIMLKRGLVDEAYEEAKEYGIDEISEEDTALLAKLYIERHGDSPDRFLTKLCEAGYSYSGYEGVVFDYLHKYYNGRMDLLIDLYRSSNAYNKPARDLEERIILKAVQTGEHPEVVSTIFRRYYENGGSMTLIKDYIEFRAGMYLYNIMKGITDDTSANDEEFFDYAEKEMIKGFAFSDDCCIAYLLQRIGKKMLDDRQLRNVEHRLKDLVRRGKMLEEFKYYKKYFELPSTLANNIIISAFSEDPEKVPRITYEITGPGETIRGTEEMEEIFRFCFVKYFTLFYGEKVVFSMDGQESASVRYADMDIQKDGSRYAVLDDLIHFRQEKQQENFEKGAMDLFIREKMTQILF